MVTMHGLKGLHEHTRQHTERAEASYEWAKRQSKSDPNPSWLFKFRQTAKRWRSWLNALERLIERAKK